MSQIGTISTSHIDIPVGNAIDDGSQFHTIKSGRIQSSDIDDGFGIRVAAINSHGIGNPCHALYAKPQNVPLPPTDIELIRHWSYPSALILYFTAVTDPEDRGRSQVHSYLIQYSPDSAFSAHKSVQKSPHCFFSKFTAAII